MLKINAWKVELSRRRDQWPFPSAISPRPLYVALSVIGGWKINWKILAIPWLFGRDLLEESWKRKKEWHELGTMGIWWSEGFLPFHFHAHYADKSYMSPGFTRPKRQKSWRHLSLLARARENECRTKQHLGSPVLGQKKLEKGWNLRHDYELWEGLSIC